MAMATTAAIVGTVVGGNALLGDPLGINGHPNSAGNDAAAQSARISADQYKFWQDNYAPVDKSLIAQAQQAGSPEEFKAAAGRANADVTGAFDQAQKQTQSRMQSFGINPGSPAYQSTAASVDLAQGAAKAGALTNAYNQQKQLAYSKGLDVAGLGRNIPAQSAASSASAANAATYASNAAFGQNTANMRNVGYGLSTLTNAAPKLYGAASNWFGSTPTANSAASMPGGDYMSNVTYANAGPTEMAGLKDGGPVTRYASGGLVGKTNDLKALLQKRGLSDATARKVITPHMKGLKPKGYADGGGVGTQGVTETGQVTGPGNGTSDSVPAQIDGQEPAALSNGEFVMSEPVTRMTGEQILTAINRAGLEMRNKASTNDVPMNAGAAAYRSGGRVARSTCGLGM